MKKLLTSTTKYFIKKNNNKAKIFYKYIKSFKYTFFIFFIKINVYEKKVRKIYFFILK